MSVTALTYLYAHLDDLAHADYALEAWEELEHATAKIERMIDRRAAATFAGTCDICKADLYATPDAQTVECRPCHVTYQTSAKRTEMLDALDDRLVRASEAVHILPGLGTVVSRKDIDRWVGSKRLLNHGNDERGRPLYRVSEVRHLANTVVRRAKAAP